MPNYLRSVLPSPAPRDLMISWIHHHGRSQGLAEALGLEPYFIRSKIRAAPVRYAVDSIKTLFLLLRVRPRSVVVMLPPTPALLTVWLFASFTKVRVVSDCHSGVFNDPKWAPFLPFSLRMMRRGLVVVTNDALAEQIRSSPVRSLVLHDPLVGQAADADPPKEPYVVVPLSYAFDEPISELISAARLLGHVRWVATGTPPADVRRSAPPNFEFSGFLPQHEYVRLFNNSAVVLALTTRSNTMQRVGYEALIANRPLVISRTATLQEFHRDAAVYVENTAESIAAGVQDALSRYDELVPKSASRLEEARAEQDIALTELRAFLDSGSYPSGTALGA